MVPYEPNLSHKFGDKRFDYLDKMRAKNTDRLQAHGVKFQNDGSFPATTSKIGYPGYLDEDTGATGDTKWEDNVEWFWPYWERGIRIHSHANGDATLEMTLDCLEELQKRKPRFDHRFTIEHYAMSNPEQAYRLAALGGAASVNIYFPTTGRCCTPITPMGLTGPKRPHVRARWHGQGRDSAFMPTSTW